MEKNGGVCLQLSSKCVFSKCTLPSPTQVIMDFWLTQVWRFSARCTSFPPKDDEMPNEQKRFSSTPLATPHFVVVWRDIWRARWQDGGGWLEEPEPSSVNRCINLLMLNLLSNLLLSDFALTNGNAGSGQNICRVMHEDWNGSCVFSSFFGWKWDDLKHDERLCMDFKLLWKFCFLCFTTKPSHCKPLWLLWIQTENSCRGEAIFILCSTTFEAHRRHVFDAHR